MVPTRNADRLPAHEIDSTHREGPRGCGRQPDRQREVDTHVLRDRGWLAGRGEEGGAHIPKWRGTEGVDLGARGATLNHTWASEQRWQG